MFYASFIFDRSKRLSNLFFIRYNDFSGYTNVKVTNFTTSWRNGLAFCGLIHSFYPDLIAYDTLTQHDIKHNCKLAFEAGEKLGITQLIEPETMVIKRIPDKLAVITYLHQLRHVFLFCYSVLWGSDLFGIEMFTYTDSMKLNNP